jgi:hypothetical protein
MPDVLLSNDDITVLGPPEIVELVLDVGATGTRGSQVFVGTGNPNSIVIGQTPVLNDLFINTSPGTDYGYLYQYISQPGGNSWVSVLKINPTLYSKVFNPTFTSGAASITIPIADIVTQTGTPLEATNFNVQYSIENANPVASSITIPALVGDGDNLVIELDAVQYASSTWSNLTGSKKVHIFISIVI